MRRLPATRTRFVTWIFGALLGIACRTPGPDDASERTKTTEAAPTEAGGDARPARDDVADAPDAALAQPRYRTPPQEVVDIVDAAPTPAMWRAPDGRRLLLGHYDANPSLQVVAQPYEALAGIRIDPARNAERRITFFRALTLLDVERGRTRDIELPPDVRLGNATWSPDGSAIGITRWLPDGLELWVIDAASAEARRVTEGRLDTVLGPGFRWMPGSKELLVWLVPSGRASPPERPLVPEGPFVEDTRGQRATNRTYPDLLRDRTDEARFEVFATAQLALVNLDGEAVRILGEPAMIADAQPSPDGSYLLVQRLRKPFSYFVPHDRFARVIEVWDRAAKVVRVVADQDVAEEIPIEGVRVGARDVHWQANEPATLVWTEALDGGDPKRPAQWRDRLMAHAAPFADAPDERTQTEHRLVDVDWLQTRGQALVREYDRDRRWTTTWWHDFGRPDVPSRRLIDRSIHDAYGDPGKPVHTVLADGTSVVLVRDNSFYLQGEGASPTGKRPFLDRMSLSDGAKERLFEAEEGTHSEFLAFVGERQGMLVKKESPQLPPNYYVVESGAWRKLTDFPDPHPQLQGIHKRIITYRRRDGVQLSGTLYLPVGWNEGQRLPLIVWAYPIEYSDKQTAGQVRASPHRFTWLTGTSPLMFLTQGYAVLDDAAMPIVGDPETMNDTFVEQVIWSAEAAVEAVVDLGIADRDRVGIAGHSYGAFMTANLLAHSDVFQAGIARSGAYNRTLTPFGFQSERRTLWEAPETYVRVSPLFAADKIDEPILLVHGAVDNNPGSFPLQSERLFAALKGTGGTARIVLLPHESHGYVARESVLHVLAESFDWFERHVKRADRRERQRSIPAAVK